MLKYKMTVPHVQLKILKMCFSFISIYSQYTGENTSYLSLCLCVYIFHRKIKKCKINLNLKVKWCPVAARLLAFCLLRFSNTV